MPFLTGEYLICLLTEKLLMTLTDEALITFDSNIYYKCI